MKHYVYKISNIIDDKHYIGVRSSKNPIKDLGIKYFSSSSDEEFMLEQRDFPERFEYNILEVFSTRKLAVAKEIELHNLYDVAVSESFYNKFKQTNTGFCTFGTKQSEEEKAKRSKTMKSLGLVGEKASMWGKKHSDETKKKMSESRAGDKHHYYNKKRTQETKEKISDSLMGSKNPNYGKTGEKSHLWGIPRSEETKRKISIANLGERNTNYGRTGEDHYLWKVPLTDEHKKKIQKAHIAHAIKTAYRFIIHDSEENLIHDELIVNIQKFCSDNEYPTVSFCESYRTNEPVKGGKFKGWTVKRIK